MKTVQLLYFMLLVSPSFAIACPDHSGLVDLNCDGKVVIVSFGDSITFGSRDSARLGYPGRLQGFFPDTTIVNLGVPGENTPTGRRRAAEKFAQYSNADYIIILEGVNDYWLDDRSAARTRANLLGMVGNGENTGAVVLLARLTAVRRDFQRGWVNSVNQAILPYTIIDFFSLGEGIISSDRLHPNGNGYQAMAQLLAPILSRVSSENRPIDTDRDNLYDFAEPRFGSSVTNPDTDGDGLLDGDEALVYGSSPTNTDSDADGYPDAFEVEIGANPASPLPAAPQLNTLRVIPTG